MRVTAGILGVCVCLLMCGGDYSLGKIGYLGTFLMIITEDSIAGFRGQKKGICKYPNI